MAEDAKFEVFEVDIGSGDMRLMGGAKTIEAAEALERMAITRRSTQDNFFIIEDAGTYKDGDKFLWGHPPHG